MKIDVTLTTRPNFDPEGPDTEPKSDEDAPVPVMSSEGLGIKVQAIPSFARKQLKMDADGPGVMIVSVDPESDAAEEGLSPRQVITAIDDVPLRSVGDWNRIVKGLKPGESVKIDIDLGGRTVLFFLTVPQTKSK